MKDLPREQTVYLHLRPGVYLRELTVAKMAKSLDAVVEPGDVVVKARISVPGDFFKRVMPTVDVTFSPEDVIPAPTINAEQETTP